MALSRAYITAKAADLAKLSPLNKRRVKPTECREVSLCPT